MAINRYRLKHLVKEKNKSAKRVSRLLEKTDRLLGVILIGNNFTHTLSTALATVVAIRIWSDNAVLAVTVFMTIIMIIFAEVMPKTIAALKPESIAFPSSYLLKPLSKILLSQLYKQLEELNYEERVLKFELNPDRADVIVPAARIYLKALEWSGGQKIYVPRFGLSDGMIKYMYKNLKIRT